MNLTINNTTFAGKREVVYAMKKAAEHSKNAELCKASSFGPRPINKSEKVERHFSSMYAYMDMATYDKAFVETIRELPNEQAGEVLKKTLMPQQLQWGETEPLYNFRSCLAACLASLKDRSTIQEVSKFVKFLEDV